MANAGGGGIKVAEVTIPSAQVLTLNGTPVEIVPAPGAGRANLIILVAASIAYVSAAYATNTTLTVGHAGVGATFTSFLANTSSKIVANGATFAAAATTAAQNAAITATVSSGNPATGDSPVTVTVVYTTINL